MSRGLRRTRFGDLVDGPPASRKLKGYAGILLSIIERARRDFLFSKTTWCQTSAAHYFLGPGYKEHILMLDLPPRWYPNGITWLLLKHQAAMYPLDPDELMRELFSNEVNAIKKKYCKDEPAEYHPGIIAFLDACLCQVDKT